MKNILFKKTRKHRERGTKNHRKSSHYIVFGRSAPRHKELQ